MYGYGVCVCSVYGYCVCGYVVYVNGDVCIYDAYGYDVYGYGLCEYGGYGHGVYKYDVCRCDAYGSPELGSVWAPEALRFSSYLMPNWSFSIGSWGLGAERSHLLYNTKKGVHFCASNFLKASPKKTSD